MKNINLFNLYIMSVTIWFASVSLLFYITTTTPIQRTYTTANVGRCHKWYSFASAYRTCLVQALNAIHPEEVWDQWAHKIGGCMGNRRFPNTYLLRNRDDVKVVVLPDDARQQACVAVTLGVGGDITAEMRLKTLAPNCEFFGADPMSEVGEIFKNVGIYHPVAVSAVGGYINASVLSASGAYKWTWLPSVSLSDYFRTYVSRAPIDHLWIDNEGAEYQIMSLFESNPSIFADVQVCQMNVELHGPLSNYNMNRTVFGKTIGSFLANSAFLPLYIMAPWTLMPHYKVFFFNADSVYCVEKYFARVCD